MSNRYVDIKLNIIYILKCFSFADTYDEAVEFEKLAQTEETESECSQAHSPPHSSEVVAETNCIINASFDGIFSQLSEPTQGTSSNLVVIPVQEGE